MVVEENKTGEDTLDPSEKEYERDEAIFAEFLANAELRQRKLLLRIKNETQKEDID